MGAVPPSPADLIAKLRSAGFSCRSCTEGRAMASRTLAMQAFVTTGLSRTPMEVNRENKKKKKKKKGPCDVATAACCPDATEANTTHFPLSVFVSTATNLNQSVA